jgi:hypothetical protein
MRAPPQAGFAPCQPLGFGKRRFHEERRRSLPKLAPLGWRSARDAARKSGDAGAASLAIWEYGGLRQSTPFPEDK